MFFLVIINLCGVCMIYTSNLFILFIYFNNNKKCVFPLQNG
jgi:hypothetical protein